MITIDDLKAYLGIDYDDDMVEKNMARCINTADSYMKSAVGIDYDDDDPKSIELLLIIAGDLYTNRSYTESAITSNTRRLVNNLILLLQLERRAKNNDI